MLNVGVLGLGKMHRMNCKFIDDVKMTAIADASKKNLKWMRT